MSTKIVTRSTQAHTITVEAANELIKIARAASQQIGFEVAIAVTDIRLEISKPLSAPTPARS